LIDPEKVWHLDVRLLLETDNGARIYVQYRGVLVVNETTHAALAKGGSTDYGDTYFMTQPRFETGAHATSGSIESWPLVKAVWGRVRSSIGFLRW
jgi:hypothetical protein